MKNQQLLNFHRIQFLRLLFEGYLEFREVYQLFIEKGELPRCRRVENLCEQVFGRLRDLGHQIFRDSPENEVEAASHDHELLCDLVIGACFHEALQLQENLFLSKLYRPRYEDLKNQVKDSKFDEYFQIGEELIEEATHHIPRNLEWISKLLLEAVALVKVFLVAQRGNRVVLRFMTQNLDLLERVYPGGEVRDLFGDMFPGGIVEAMWLSGKDLHTAAHNDAALDCLSRLAVILHETPLPDQVQAKEILKTLDKIRIEGQKLRDNALVSRSQSLTEQFIATVGASA